MSLFSRLERVRNGREAKDRDEGGLFGVPDLGTTAGQTDDNQAAAPQASGQSSEPNPLPTTSTPTENSSRSFAAVNPATQAVEGVAQEPKEEAKGSSIFGSASPSPFSAASLPKQSEAEVPQVQSSQGGSQSETKPAETAFAALTRERPVQNDDGQDLVRLAIGETAETELESPFMSAIAPPVHTSASERLPTAKGPFRSPAMFKGENKPEAENKTAETATEKAKDFVSDDTSLNLPAAQVELPSVTAPAPAPPVAGFDDLPSAVEPISAAPEAIPAALEPISTASEAIPAAPESMPTVAQPVASATPPAPATPPTPAPPKSPFDRLMAERISAPAAPATTPAPAAEVKPRPSLLDRLNARAINPEEAQAAPKPAAVVTPPAPIAPVPVPADEPLDRDAEIPAQYMPHVAATPPAAVTPLTVSPEPEKPTPAPAQAAVPAPAEIPAAVQPPQNVVAPADVPAVKEVAPIPAMPTAPSASPTPPATRQVTPIVPQSVIDPQIPAVSNVGPKPDTPLEDFPVDTMAVVEKPAEPRNLSSIVAGTRGFADRLAARESLDRDLSVPTSVPSPRPTGAELVRIDEEANLSEKEMKVRILYRQKHLIFDSVLGSLDPRLMQNPTRENLRPPLERAVDGALREFNLALDPSERAWMIDEFVRETTDVGPLVPLLDDPGISKIIVTGANDVSVEKLGRIERVGISFRDDDHLLALVRRIAEMTGGRIDAKVPLLDRPLPDGSRIRAKVPPIAPQPSLTIEKSTGNPFIALKRSMNERTRGEALPYNQLRERIQLRLLREFEGNTAATANQEKLRVQVEEMIGQVILEEKVAVTRAEKAALVMDLLNEIVGLGPLEPLLNDPDVDEVMVNGPYQIYVERKGKLELSNQRFRDNAHAMQVIERIIAPLGRRIDEKSPMVDGRLRDGSRFNAIIPPLALGGPTMTIRKFARDPFTMTDLINFGSLTREAAQFLHAAVEGRLNIIVSGGTGSGKTTTLNVLSSFIPSSDRIVTIEDAAELQLRQEHTIRLETRPANIEGVGEITIRDLVRNALRMRPDRIVVGECRGGEALDMLQAMNTGHDGSLTTAHSNGPRDTLKRLETMVMMAGFDLPIKAIREQIAMAVQLIVHQERMRDGKRRITAVTEIVGMEGDVITLQDLFRFEQERIDEEGRIHGSLAPTGLRPKNWDTIVDNGAELSMELFQRVEPNSGVRSRLSEHRVGAR